MGWRVCQLWLGLELIQNEVILYFIEAVNKFNFDVPSNAKFLETLMLNYEDISNFWKRHK